MVKRRHWQGRLFLLLTCLTVAVLTLLPPRLSELGDLRDHGGVHCEALPEDSNFPSAPPALSGRIYLLAQWQQSPEKVTIVQQLLEEPGERKAASGKLFQALEDLTEAGVIPAGQPEFGGNFAAVRMYLRNQSDLSSAGYLNLSATDAKRWHSLSMTLDLETGKVLSFRMAGPSVFSEELPAETMGERFLVYLGDGSGDGAGLDWETVPAIREWKGPYTADTYTEFRLSAGPCRYSVRARSVMLAFEPFPDESAWDGLPENGSAVSAVS